MKTGWKIVGIVCLVIVFLGALCVGIGMMSGAESARIYSELDHQLNLSAAIDTYSSYAHEVSAAFAEAGF